MDYVRNLKYFKPDPEQSIAPGVITIIRGIVLMLILSGIINAVAGFITGLVVIIGGIIAIIYTIKDNQKRIKVTDTDIDKICMEYLANLQSMAMKKLGIDEDQVQEALPISFSGYYFNDVGGSPRLIRKGDDGRYRSSNYNAVMFLFSDEQVYCYEHRFSLVQNENEEATDEIFYSDIVSVSTRSEAVTYNFDQKDVTFNTEAFNLTTSGGTSIGATISDKENAENSIKGMRSLLRSKKQQ